MVRLAPRLGMIDRPEERKVHSIPMARVGGWGIIFGTLITVAIWLPMDRLVQSYLFGSLVLLAFGTADDCRNMGHWSKFVGQFIAVLPVVIYAGLYVERLPFMGTDSIGPGFGIPFTIFAMMGVINAINHSDGLDGLAGGESLLCLTVIALLAHLTGDGVVVVVTAVATIGGVMGFLRYNTHPAEVFMGDSGSQFIGFTLGFLVVLLTQRVNPALSPALPALLLGLPVIDILVVLGLRIYHGMNWFRASRNHIHHRLLDLGFQHYESVVIIYSLQAFLIINAVLLRYHSDLLILGLYSFVCSSLFVLLTIGERSGWKAHRPGERGRLTESIRVMKQHRLFTTAPLALVAVAIPLYVFIVSLSVREVPRDFGVISAALFLIFLWGLVSGKDLRSIPMRGTVYIAVTFIVYLRITFPRPALEVLQSYETAYFVLLALAIALAVRYAVDVKFKTTPMDYLIVFLVVTIGIFSTSYAGGLELSSLVIKIVVTLYGCELLINRTKQRWQELNLSFLVALGILGIRGIF
ncbi:MAG: undecaprenyl/decaprenyl-phosphate alpha-N-acetylglucosaminyl 1-phosphate transferase [Gammaproteobacteria bacterium]|nr:undecaprenyl/decaprenyl-phosphate alpha-N-acetylglucosaminyl 1-phosphate transferase [Gammaproteobacteria bacterium]